MSTAHYPLERISPRWRERWIGLRNRLIGDPRFQRWAAASPVTRSIARRRARALFDLCAGFVYSQTLLACVRLRLFEILAEAPRDIEALSRLLELPPDSTTRLLRAAASLRLVRPLAGGRYALADLGASMLGNPSIAAFVEHHTLLYDDMRDPVALLRGETHTRLSAFWPYAENRPPPDCAPSKAAALANKAQGMLCDGYSELMSKTQPLIAQDILDAYPFTAHMCLLDVGGGEGAFLAAAAARAPQLKLKLFDLAPVAARARRNLVAAGLETRVDVAAGSFLTDALPGGADLISFVRILHDHDDESAILALRAAHAALPPGGTLLVAEPMAQTPGAEPIGDAYFGFYLLAMGRGRGRTASELRRLLEISGFAQMREVRTSRPLLSRIIVGHRV